MFGWEPEPYYNLTEVEEHPTMPQTVKNNISKQIYEYAKSSRTYIRDFDFFLKLTRYQYLKTEELHMTKETNWHFSFINRLSNKVSQS